MIELPDIARAFEYRNNSFTCTAMASDLYRFRRASAVLDEFHELERQEIYFASAEELNDPMEGYKDVFWQGDSIVWHNLLRHFILVLMSMVHRRLGGPAFGDADIRKVIFHTAEDLPPPPATAREIYAQICRDFFSHAEINTLVQKLGSMTRPVRREELSHYLRAIQTHVLILVLNHPSLTAASSGTMTRVDLSESLPKMIRTVEALSGLDPEQVRSAQALFTAGEAVAAQAQLRTF